MGSFQKKVTDLHHLHNAYYLPVCRTDKANSLAVRVKQYFEREEEGIGSGKSPYTLGY